MSKHKPNTKQAKTIKELKSGYESIADIYDANMGYTVVVFYDHEFAQWEYMLDPKGNTTGAPRQIWC